MAAEHTQTFSDSTFDKDVLQSDQPVLVDFWAEWCGPCRQMTPTIETLAAEYAGRVKVGKLNVDHNNGVAARYQIRGIPTLLLFKGGKVVEQMVGARSKADVQRVLEAHLQQPV